MVIFTMTLFLCHLLYSVLEINCSFRKQRSSEAQERLQRYRNLRRKIDLIKEECGDFCDMSPSRYVSTLDDNTFYYVPMKKPIDCNRLWNNSIFDEKSEFDKAIQILPKYLQAQFSHENMVDIMPDYYDELSDNIWKINETFNKWGKKIPSKFVDFSCIKSILSNCLAFG